ncbi:hypothetical protein B9479_007869, partial [Cryptococcus floricola]
MSSTQIVQVAHTYWMEMATTLFKELYTTKSELTKNVKERDWKRKPLSAEERACVVNGGDPNFLLAYDLVRESYDKKENNGACSAAYFEFCDRPGWDDLEEVLKEMLEEKRARAAASAAKKAANASASGSSHRPPSINPTKRTAEVSSAAGSSKKARVNPNPPKGLKKGVKSRDIPVASRLVSASADLMVAAATINLVQLGQAFDIYQSKMSKLREEQRQAGTLTEEDENLRFNCVDEMIALDELRDAEDPTVLYQKWQDHPEDSGRIQSIKLLQEYVTGGLSRSPPTSPNAATSRSRRIPPQTLNDALSNQDLELPPSSVSRPIIPRSGTAQAAIRHTANNVYAKAEQGSRDLSREKRDAILAHAKETQLSTLQWCVDNEVSFTSYQQLAFNLAQAPVEHTEWNLWQGSKEEEVMCAKLGI